MTVPLAETSLQEWAQMLEQLLEIARTQGYLTYSDILEALPQPEHHVADVDQLYAALQAEGIRVVETAAEISDTPPSIEDELLAAYRPPTSIDSHPIFIRASALLKEARELDAAGEDDARSTRSRCGSACSRARTRSPGP